MNNVDIIVMGKTGAGKSTLINAVFGKEVACTGIGQAVTRENVVYSKPILLPSHDPWTSGYNFVDGQLNMYDTVGLEIDSKITDATLNDIKLHIQKTKDRLDSSDIHLVWFCVNDRSNRFEPFEIDLVRKLSFEYEIPFVIVLTQCFSDERGELGDKISTNLPQIMQRKVLAKDYSTRGGTIKAFGVFELLYDSVKNYQNLKADILEKKLDELDESRAARIDAIKREGYNCVSKYSDMATKIGIVPVGCIPVIHGLCIKMIADLNSIAGFCGGKGFASEIFTNVVIGVVATPMMAVPLLSIATACAYIEAVGEDYVDAMLAVIDESTDLELLDNQLIKMRLKKELTELKNEKNGGI